MAWTSTNGVDWQKSTLPTTEQQPDMSGPAETDVTIAGNTLVAVEGDQWQDGYQKAGLLSADGLS